MHDRISVAAACGRWRWWFVGGFAAIFIAKLALAATLQPFGDEAFYWQESRHLAWGYSDLPPLTAWLIRLGETVAGHGLLGMRWPFLLLGSALPWLVVAFGRQAFDAKTGWQAGLLCLALPLAGSLGALALPDVPLTVAIMLALLFLLRATASQRWVDWLGLGMSLALAWMTHYRAAMAILVGLIFMLATVRGRQQWRKPGFWLAMAVAVLGLVPLAISNWQQDGAGLAFQLVDRNPWRFHADALVQPLEQALTCTPLLYLLLLWAAWTSGCRRKHGAPWDLIASASIGFLGLYFALGLFADDQRFRVHWPLPGYLPLLAALPWILGQVCLSPARRWLVAAAFALAGMGQLTVLAYAAAATTPAGARWLGHHGAFPDDFVGWRQASDAARAMLAKQPAVLVADNFMLAAELQFQLGAHVPVYTLDSPQNVKYGRAPQLAVWHRDEAALRRQHAGQPMLLVVAEREMRARERPLWLGSLCHRIDDPVPTLRLNSFDGRKPMAFYRGRVPISPIARAPLDPEIAARCPIWRHAQAGSPQ